jgi:hypothetical protein
MNELMHRLTRYCAGWVTATALATGVSWVAIQNLVTTAALSPLSVPVLATVAPSVPDVVVTRTTPRATGSAPRSTSERTSRSVAPTPKKSARVPKVTPTPTSTPTIKGYSSPGGRIVLELRPTSVELVSAIPAAGYRTETWKTDYWIRIDFVKGERRSSLIASWYEHEPVIQETEF